MYLANQRAGTHSTLRRGEVAGSTKKLFRQKGTGNARVGTRRTNKRRGGGTAKGPKPRDYEYHLPKKMVRAATRMAILSKFQDNEAVVVDDLNLPETQSPKGEALIKTKEMVGRAQGPEPEDKKPCLVGTAGLDKNALQVGPQYRWRRGAAGQGIQRLHRAQAEAVASDAGRPRRTAARGQEDRSRQDVR